jgi:hypothetical protein
LNSPRPHHLASIRTLIALAVLLVFVTGGAVGIAQGAVGQTAGDVSHQPPQASLQAAAAQGPSLSFGALFTRASYGNLELSYNTLAVETADLNMLLSTNVQCIRIDIGYAPWLTNDQTAINEMSGLVQDIRAAGRCLIIADAASETYRKAPLTWSQFMAAWVPRVSTLAALYHPDYYVVIKEPGWYVPLISDARTNPQFTNESTWFSLTENLTNAVLSVSPSTVVGVAIGANSLTQSNGAFYSQYLNQIQTIPGLSFIGFDIYSQSDQTATQNYLSQNPPSKAVWIPETWSTPNGTAMQGNPSDDAQWIRSMYDFALSYHCSFIIPFYTDDFASYSLVSSPPTDPAQILSLYEQRTPVFSAFESLAAAAGNSSALSSSSSLSSSTGSVSSSTNATETSPSTKTATSSQTTHSSTETAASGGKSFFARKAVIAGIVLLIVLVVAAVGVFMYYRRRR